MREIAKGLVLFILNWALVIVFYHLSILVYIGKLLQILMNTPSMPAASILVDVFLVVFVSYFLNKKFIKAGKLTFVISASLFGFSAIVLFLLAVRAVVRGILMNS
jgi:hypothetical protein